MSEEGKLKKLGAPAFIALSLGLAGYMTYSTLMRKPINEMPDKIESASPFACSSCTWTGLLTPRQQAQQQMKGLHVERAITEEGYATSFRILTLTCPGCEKIAAKVAHQCEGCNSITLGSVCAKCGKDLKSGDPVLENGEPAETPESNTDPRKRT